MSQPSLQDIQRLLVKLIAAPEGVASGLDRLTATELGQWDGLISRNAALSAVDRLDIYANMYFFRLRDSLAEDFPTVSAVLGRDAFHNLITDYLLAHPPAHFSLRYAGQHLAAFVATWSPGAGRPFLADLARLEWAILEAFDALDEEPIDRGQLTVIPPESWPQLRFEVTASLQLLDLGWTVQVPWSCIQEERSMELPRSQPTWLRVWRQERKVYQSPISVAEHAALQALRTGEPFARVCEITAAAAGAEASAELISGLLATWVADGLLVRVIAPDSSCNDA